MKTCHLSIFVSSIAWLAACGQRAPETSVGEPGATTASAVAGAGAAYVHTDHKSQRLSLCGRADVTLTNAALASAGEAFVAGQPPDFPSTYWGIARTDAYICLDISHYVDAQWKVNGTLRGGAFDIATLVVYGFRADQNGQPTDV